MIIKDNWKGYVLSKSFPLKGIRGLEEAGQSASQRAMRAPISNSADKQLLSLSTHSKTVTELSSLTH